MSIHIEQKSTLMCCGARSLQGFPGGPWAPIEIEDLRRVLTGNPPGQNGYHGQINPTTKKGGKGLIIAITNSLQTRHADPHLRSWGFEPLIGFQNTERDTNALVFWARVRKRLDIPGIPELLTTKTAPVRLSNGRFAPKVA